jgi:hypothetical protein
MAQQYGAVNSYFVPGFGISRAIIQSEIRYFCGPDAIVRPYTHQVCAQSSTHMPHTNFLKGRDGFLVTTAGPPLTRVHRHPPI